VVNHDGARPQHDRLRRVRKTVEDAEISVPSRASITAAWTALPYLGELDRFENALRTAVQTQSVRVASGFADLVTPKQSPICRLNEHYGMRTSQRSIKPPPGKSC